MIEARSVSKQFGSFVALDDVSVEVPGGIAHRAARPERQREVDAPCGSSPGSSGRTPGAC